MGKKRYALVVLLLLAGFLVLWVGQRNRSVEAYNNHNLIRVQVLAHSDAPEDQAVKYRVRDALVGELAARLKDVNDVEKARETVTAALPRLQEVAAAQVAAAGRPYGVRVAYGNFDFPTRAYGNLMLPAGTYEALRVVLGAGYGANWWCIVFPPLCFVDAPLAPAAEANQSGDNPCPDKVEIRFRFAELVKAAFEGAEN